MKKDNLWDRMKAYESNYDFKLLKRVPVIIRLDWRAFHTFTKWCKKPFDIYLISAFHAAIKSILKDIQWRNIAYHQSDEVSILITDYDTLETQWFFDYRVNKINSVVASVMSNAFNSYYNWDRFAEFDCRCFNIPEDDVANYFLRRQKDRARNSLQMFARSYYSTKELQWKKTADLHEMIFKKWDNRNNLMPLFKNWTYFTKNWEVSDIVPTYNNINDLIQSCFKDEDQQQDEACSNEWMGLKSQQVSWIIRCLKQKIWSFFSRKVIWENQEEDMKT